MKKAGFVWMVFLTSFLSLLGQEPYHFMLGSDEFATIDIYDLSQTQDGRYWIATSDGIYRSTNATSATPSWSKRTNGITDEEFIGLEFHPTNSNIMYASGLDIYRSSNGGSSYASITGSGTGLDLNNLPSSTADVLRIGIAVSPAAAGDLWAYVVCEDPSASTGKRIYVYRRTGSTWTMIRDWAPGGGTNNTSKGWTAIAVSPIDADKVYYGFTKVAGTENGGTSWQSKSPYSGNGFHADVHALAIPPNVSNPQRFCGHHGGVSQKDPSNTGTGGWTFLCDGLEVATIWAFDDSEFDSDRIIIGNQDCGTNVTNGSGGWQVIRGGDGYNGRIDDESGLMISSANGTVNMFDYVNQYSDTKIDNNTNIKYLEYNWNLNEVVKEERI